MWQAPTAAILPDARVAHVHLFRHGAVETGGRRVCRGQADVPLSPAGLAQSDAAAAAFLTRFGAPDRVLSSDLSRCRTLAERFGVPVEAVAALREQDMGDWEGRDWDELSAADGAAVTAYWDDYVDGRPTGGETWAEAAARVSRWWAGAADGFYGGRVVIVAHVGTLRALLCHWLGLPPGQALRFAPAYASHTHVLHAEAGVVLETFGERLYSSQT